MTELDNPLQVLGNDSKSSFFNEIPMSQKDKFYKFIGKNEGRYQGILKLVLYSILYWGLYSLFDLLTVNLTLGFAVSPWYLPAGLELSFVLMCGTFCLPIIYVTELSSVFWTFPNNLPIAANLIWTLGKSSVYAIEAYIILSKIKTDLRFGTLKDMLSFIFFVPFVHFIIGWMFILTLTLSGVILSGSELGTFSLTWVLGDMAGIFAICFIWFKLILPRILIRQLNVLLDKYVILDILLLALGLLSAFEIGGLTSGIATLYFVFIPVVFTTIRRGVQGAVLISFLVNTTVLIILELFDTSIQSINSLQLYLIIVTLTGLLLGVVVDERQEYLKNKKEVLQLYSDLYNNSPDAYLTVDIESKKVLFANKATYKLLEYTKSELENLTLFNIYSEECHDKVKDIISLLLQNGQVEQKELQIITKSGEKKDVLLSSSLTIDKDDRQVTRSTWKDITYLKILTRNLENETKKANHASKAKSQFLANMSHEIRTPMNGIFGIISLLKGTELDETQQEYIDICEQSSKSLMTIIDDVLLFSKAEVGKIILEHVEFDFYSLIKQTIQSFIHTKKHVELIYGINKNIPQCLIGDPSRLRQILFNILGNAFKFTDRGEIYLNVDKLDYENEDNQIELKFEVRDTGIGMSPEFIPKLFNPFTQNDESTTRKYGGTGLGLSICRSLVELFEGTISAKSILGVGSVFTWTIKLKKSNTNFNTENLNLNLDSLTVVIVDDNKTNIFVLEKLLNEVKCNPISFSNPLLAMNELKRTDNKIDVIIVDYNMPEMNGLEFITEIRSFNKQVKILLLPSHFEESIIKNSKINSFEYILKPINKDILINKLNIITKTLLKKPILTEDVDILILEDNETNQFVLKNMLKKYKTKSAYNGKEGLDIVQTTTAKLAIVDLHMPVMSGFEFIENFKKTYPTNPMRFIILTADITTEAKEKAIQLDIKHFLHKPIDKDKLQTIIREILNSDEKLDK